MKNCIDCNRHFNDDRSAFCPFCGKQLVGSLTCGNCNCSNRWDSKFCGKCGSAIADVSTQVSHSADKLQRPGSKTNVDLSSDSILDVTNRSYTIPAPDREITLTKYSSGIPFWEHHYVYSASEIQYASETQKAFYQYFKSAFLKGVFLDLEGMLNYAFILLFDLVEEYDTHRDIRRLEKYLYDLGQLYPKTRSYGRNLLYSRMAAQNYSDGLTRLREQQEEEYGYWTFGGRYKKKLNLTAEEVAILDKPSYPSSNFSDIEYCRIEIIKLYLSTIKKLKAVYLTIGTTLDKDCERIADLVARKHFRYRPNSYNYQWAIQSVTSNIYSVVIKHCENAVRERYGHKRKLNTNIYDSPEAKAEIEESVLSKIQGIIQSEQDAIGLPDEDTEIELNAQNTNRWKLKFQELTIDGIVNGKQFVADLLELGRLNRRNPSIENIFYEGSKFIAKIDKEAALTLYIYYLYYDLRSIKFDNKKFTKTIQKSLFKTNGQLHEFQVVVSDFINDRNLERALLGVSKIYVAKRKEIRLNKEAVEEAHSKHSSTVGLLNEFLQDEFEDNQLSIVSKEINSREVQIEITQKTRPIDDKQKLSNVELNPFQTELLIQFAKSNFYILQDDVEGFARSKGVFRNQLVESINDACYEVLDDVLIEEEDENYVVSADYLKRIINI